MAGKYPRILFFINGSVPSWADVEESERYGMNVVFRNALWVPAEGALEACDGVAGRVPARYAAAYPSAEEALEAFLLARQQRASGLSQASAGSTHGQVQEQTESKPEASKDGKKKQVVWEPNAS